MQSASSRLSCWVGDLTDASQILTFGEVHTGLLQNSTALAQDRVAAVLDLVVGERVRRSERPIPHGVSPDRLTGVDCLLPSASRRDTRCIGTVVAHAAITGGHVVQGSSYTSVTVLHRRGQRQPWSHYLARPGSLEAIGKAASLDVADGFLTGPPRREALDIGAISGRLVDEVQSSAKLDRGRPMRTTRTRLRWAVLPAMNGTNRAEFTIESRTDRTLRLWIQSRDTEAAVALCEDIALHDWLLTTVESLLESSLTTPGTRAQRVDRLRPVVDHLLHLWMPAARVPSAMLPVWDSLESRPGFTRQWRASVDRIRDQLTLNTMALMEATADETIT